MKNIFTSKTKRLEAEIENYLDLVSSSGMIFREGVRSYLSDDKERFEQYNKEIKKVESGADKMRREIKRQLYTYMLIPESRGDVLGLLETIDDVVDVCEKVLAQFSIEQPEIPDELEKRFQELVDHSHKAVECLVKGVRAFFIEISQVSEYVSKVHFYEHEADKVEELIKYRVFRMPGILEFSKRVHLRYFIEEVSLIAGTAEIVAERLDVYAIKRRV